MCAGSISTTLGLRLGTGRSERYMPVMNGRCEPGTEGNEVGVPGVRSSSNKDGVPGTSMGEKECLERSGTYDGTVRRVCSEEVRRRTWWVGSYRGVRRDRGRDEPKRSVGLRGGL